MDPGCPQLRRQAVVEPDLLGEPADVGDPDAQRTVYADPETRHPLAAAGSRQGPKPVQHIADGQPALRHAGNLASSLPEPSFDPDAFYDAGEQGCAGPALGDINRILESLSAGQTLEVRSADATGRENFRAYCRLRGYVIEREIPGPDGDRLLVRK